MLGALNLAAKFDSPFSALWHHQLKMSGLETTSGDDDLDISHVVDRDLAIKKSPAQGSTSRNRDAIKHFHSDEAESTSSDDGKTSHQARRDTEPARIDWSEDEEDAYHIFKNRKALKRKRMAAQTKKAPKGRKTQVYGASLSDSDDHLMESTLPDYLKDRRARFDGRQVALKEAGLKLPPSYEEIFFSDDERLEELQERPQFAAGKPAAKYEDIHLPYSLGIIPAPVAQWLRDYQVQGVSFLHKLFVYQTGGILGDDMGLGKTIQVIAFLTAAFGKTADERDDKRMRKVRRADGVWYPKILIICPGTLLENWKAEFERWGWWHVDFYHGTTRAAALQAATTGRLEIMITTYTTYRLSKGAINMIEWDCVVADECHQLKGRNSETTQAMNEINALCRIGLTGTAIQNSYDELWTILNWTNPGKFGPMSTWKKTISEPLKMGQSHDATVAQLSKARKTAEALVHNLLPLFFLRRMKTLIAHQLPKKSDRVVFCPLTPTQAEAYQNLLDSETIECIKYSLEICHCGSGKKQGWCCHQKLANGSKWQNHVFPAIVNLQKLANHLAILIPQSSDPVEKQEKDLAMLELAVPDMWQSLYRNRDSIINFSNPEFCGKWKILRKLLKFWFENGDKVLVFSHSVRLLKMLQMLFNHTSYNVSYLDGAMSYDERARQVDDFNSDPQQFVFLISTKAGGVGLNITSANKVVIVDPNWNPAFDLQAQDRAYRIGQVRDVEVFRLVSVGTIEEIVYARQIYKQQQANIGYTASKERRYFQGVQNNTAQKGEIFGLANLFAFHTDNFVLREIINKTNVAESRANVDVVHLHVDTAHAVDPDDPLLAASDDEDGAMSQLAALVAKDEPTETTTKRRATSKRSDPVQAILAAAGVEYTHENSEVIGSSKVETHLSRHAEAADNDINAAKQPVFAGTPEPKSRAAWPLASEAVDGEEMEMGIEWQYRPPEDVLRRQFCTMATTFGYEDTTEFALVVEGWTQAQRRNCLDRFYLIRRRHLGISGRGVVA